MKLTDILSAEIFTIKDHFLVVFSNKPFVTLVATFVTSDEGVAMDVNGRWANEK